MLTRILAAVTAALVLALAGTGWLLKAQIVKTATVVAEKQQVEANLSTAQAALKRVEAAMTRLRQENAATARETALLRRSLEAALAENRAWSDSTLPHSVREVFNARSAPAGQPSGGSPDGVLRGGDAADDHPTPTGQPPGPVPGTGSADYHEW